MSLSFSILSAETVPANYSWDYGLPFSSDSPLLKELAPSAPTRALGRAPGINVTFRINAFLPETTYIWNFGDFYNDANNIIATQGDIVIDHVFLMPGTYNVTLSSDNNKTGFTIMSAVVVTEIAPDVSMHSVTRPITGNSPYTITFTPHTIIPGSFPIDKIDWDFGDGSPIQTVTRFYIPDTSVFTYTGLFSADRPDPRNYNPTHTYVRTSDTTSIFYPSITAYSSSTGTYNSCSIGIGPIFINQNVKPDDMHILKVRNYNQEKIYCLQNSDDLAILTTTETNDDINLKTLLPSNKIKDSFGVPFRGFTGNPGSPLYPPLNIVIDPFFTNVSLLLHLEGENNTPLYIDSSDAQNIFLPENFSNPPLLSNTNKKFGNTSLLLNGSQAIVSQNNSSFNFNAGEDFTLEGWYNFTNLGFTTPLFFKQSAYAFFIFNNTFIEFDNQQIILIGRPFTFSLNSWYHIALTRYLGNLRIFVNGNQIGAPASSADVGENINQSLASFDPFFIGKSQIGSYFSGFIDEVRITKGIARYTQSFTPPTEAFVDTRIPFY